VATRLAGPHYVLGELAEDHATIPGLDRRLADLRILPKADFWGWGTIRRTERGVEALAVETATATLRAAGVHPAAVDALVLCSTRFPSDTNSHGRYVETIMTGIGLDGADFLGVTLHRCANLLAGVRLADTLVAGGRHRRVLVVTADRVHDESVRMEKFALFSDGAASCLVTDADDTGGFELVSTAAAHNIRELDWSNEISADLARRVNDSLLKSRGLVVADVAGLLHANVFKPVVMLKEIQAGFTATQLFTGNISRVGHCFAADPLINLVDRAAAGALEAGRYYMLASSVPGSRIGALLRADGTGETPWGSSSPTG
jgi:3-oxoacyl-[acyl-carrier-protein] synthase-3